MPDAIILIVLIAGLQLGRHLCTLISERNWKASSWHHRRCVWSLLILLLG